MMQLAVFFVALGWAALANSFATRAARGLVVRFNWSDGFLLVDAAFLVFLLAVGFSALDGVARRRGPAAGTKRREVVGLPNRPTRWQEWATGAAIGWGIITLAVLPMALAGKLHVHLWGDPEAFWLTLLNLAAVLLLALASEIVFRGMPYRRLMAAVGPFWGTVVLAMIYGWVVTLRFNAVFHSGSFRSGALAGNSITAGSFLAGPDASNAAIVIAMLLGLLLSWAWLRTRGLWLGWGLHFGWVASLGILFGLPVLGVNNLSTVIETRAIGVEWLTGGEFGPEGAAITILLLLAGLVVLVRVTRDWAWAYTHAPIVAAGYPMEVAPPPAHAAMEQAPRPPALVQILPTTPQSRSAGEP